MEGKQNINSKHSERWHTMYNEFFGKYEISCYGRIRTVGRFVNCAIKNNSTVYKKSKILKTNINKDGYEQVTLKIEGKNKTRLIHRLVADIFITNPENKRQINHKDADKTNNFTDNLEWVTHQENMDHASKNRLYPFGINHPTVKITKEQLSEIRNKYPINSSRKLGIEYGVTKTTIMNIVKFRTRKYESEEK
jgi:hypothetical protein